MKCFVVFLVTLYQKGLACQQVCVIRSVENKWSVVIPVTNRNLQGLFGAVVTGNENQNALQNLNGGNECINDGKNSCRQKSIKNVRLHSLDCLTISSFFSRIASRMSQRDVENVVDKRDKFKRWHMLNKLFEICVSSYTVYFVTKVFGLPSLPLF